MSEKGHGQNRKNEGRPAGRVGAMMPGEKARNFGPTIKKLIGYLAEYKFRVIIVCLFAVLATVGNTIGLAILGNATDIIVEGIRSGGVDFDRLFKVILFLLGLFGGAWVFAYCQGFIMAKVSQMIIYKLRQQMSEKLDRLPLKYYDKKTHGEIQSRFVNDIETINQSLLNSITQTISSAATVICILVMMISISPIMTVIALLILPASMVIIRLVIKHSQGHFHDQQRYLGDVNGHVEEMYTGHTIIKAFGREKITADEFDEINDKLCESAWKSQFYSGLMMPLTNFVGNLGYVAMCILGGYLAFAGTISIGNIQTFLLYVRNLNQPVQNVANVMNLLQSTAAAAERIFELIEEDEEDDAFGTDSSDKIDFDVTTHKGEVSFRNVRFGYEADSPVIRDFSYVAKPGSRVAIVGPTGAGKTTIVKLLMRYYELDGGDIFIDDHDIVEYSRSDLRALFGMVLQDAWLFSGSIKDNIKYGTPGATDEEVIAAAKAAHIHHFITTLPQGYDTLINEEATNISQGQKQLLTIARAMLADNPILILDEATSSVDTRTERLIQSAMARLMEGRTSFVIAHRLSTIKDADHILVMDNGDIVEQGSHTELLALDGYYAKLYNSQFE
ncbi:MAG: ABC transporter ATP-binding protein [Firmicutes bacterium]|nr:ABC transporter ATP-binding protein [Bacillota bacterium]